MLSLSTAKQRLLVMLMTSDNHGPYIPYPGGRLKEVGSSVKRMFSTQECGMECGMAVWRYIIPPDSAFH